MNLRKDIIPSKIIEFELQIKLLEFLKREGVVDESMYRYVINRLINKITLEKNKINEYYLTNSGNYKLITN